ncbi:MAG: DNA topoisomerase I [Candidatus Aenigmatarchaeota archaeon]
MVTIVIAEKPTAAKVLSKALAEKGLKENISPEGAKWYEFTRKGKKHIVVSAAGHLFTLKQKKKDKTSKIKSSGWGYPVFDVDWVPSHEASKFSAFSKKFYDVIMQFAGKGDDFIIATDYDTEGEVIGRNILNFIFKKNDAKRMKFSTMTKEELIGSYENMIGHINIKMSESGLARHYMDHMWGISLSRALISAIKSSGRRFKIISTGRVQGPTLHMLAKHEKKISIFKPKPFWQIVGEVSIGKRQYPIEYEDDKIWDKKDADNVLKKSKVKEATVKDVKKKVMMQKPPRPYNTTSFLSDVYRYFGYSPQQAMAIAEALYQAGLISYPRTSSEKLPKDINYKKIISNISNNPKYAKETKILLNKSELVPEEGAKTDAAHPAIYPTGESSKRIGSHQQKVYDLVVRRFFAVFGDPAKRESQRIFLDLGGNLFFLTGKRTLEPGWTLLYGKYAAREEIMLPEIKIGSKLFVKNISQLSKKTQPPARFSQGSVMKEMENRGLGTKATRAGILQILYNRGYLIGRSIEVTDLGLKLSDILEKSVPDIVSEKLTRHFEEECEDIERGKQTREKVITEAKTQLTKICNQFRKKEKIVGEQLTKAIIESQEKQNTLGVCPRCGGTIKMMRLWTTKKRFAGCSGYPKCDFSAPLPSFGFIQPTEKVCEHCKTPIVQVQRVSGRPFRMCLDLKCPTKKEWYDKKKHSKMTKSGKIIPAKDSGVTVEKNGDSKDKK